MSRLELAGSFFYDPKSGILKIGKRTYQVKGNLPMSRAEKKRAAKFIPEEMKTGKYERRQAIAIGISRARKGF